jgi:hypothetical protein
MTKPMVDVLSLLGDGLIDSIKEVGVPEDKVGALSNALGDQLGGDDGLDLGDLLGGLDLDSFLENIDTNAIAEQVGISPAIISAAVNLIGPKVAEFVPGGVGGLGAMAGKLFD